MPTLQDLAAGFWTWRAANQPFSSDDIPRIRRPAGFAPDWSRVSVEKQQRAVDSFEEQVGDLDLSAATVSDKVDYRLIASAIARVRWELDVLRSWERNPRFYV